ncbi:single-stranded DNA-binding protein WHY1, chloroplastic [Trifolium repens]|nr:single-stranded DNA-binding protein WHY1, chloroplastic [Trifolium repens]
MAKKTMIKKLQLKVHEERELLRLKKKPEPSGKGSTFKTFLTLPSSLHKRTILEMFKSNEYIIAAEMVLDIETCSCISPPT